MDYFLNFDKNDGGYFGKHREAIEIKKKKKKNSKQYDHYTSSLHAVISKCGSN